MLITSKYNAFKRDVLEAEQHLLRVLNYDMETTRYNSYKLLLSYMHHFKRTLTLTKSLVQSAT